MYWPNIPTHSPLHVTHIQLGVGVSLVVLEELVFRNDSGAIIVRLQRIRRNFQNKERIGKKIAIRGRLLVNFNDFNTADILNTLLLNCMFASGQLMEDKFFIR